MDKKKILFVINTLSRAGAETAMITLLKKLLNGEYEGLYDISLYVITSQGDMWDELPAGVRVLNRNISNVSVLTDDGRKILRKTCTAALIQKGGMNRHFSYLLRNALSMIAYGKVRADKLMWRVLSDTSEIFNEHYDLAVAFLEGGSTYYTADHVNADIKAAFVHVDYVRAGYNRKLDLDCYDHMDRIFTVSAEVRDSFLKVYPEKSSITEVFPNLIDRDRIIALSEKGLRFNDGFDGRRIVTVGRLTDQKSFEVSIEAMKIIVDKLKDRPDLEPVRWYLIGDGDRRKFLTECIRRYGLENDFILCGAVDNPYPYIAGADLYVHVTGYEGKSIAIQEARILGKAVIASDRSGNREQITEGIDGLLCAFDPESVADTVLGLIYDDDLLRKYGNKAAYGYLDDEEAAGKAVEKLVSLPG